MFSGLKLLQPHPPAHPVFLDLKDSIQQGDSSQRPGELNRYVVRKLHLNLPESVHDKARQDNPNSRGHYRGDGKAPKAISLPLQQLDQKEYDAGGRNDGHEHLQQQIVMHRMVQILDTLS